ncbi:glucose 1-dehydrogenase [Vagococcus silagei]|uniref:Glucose 1-dehydrogenase n=1 Tax=Vagococcus silagei TaxID=2508885 RepID=A0A4S3B6M2_9ENTE|nr:glucose 1-dehydrogenase [Vagococcus silagei]THB61216.1 glucose 1-dehydrogenase [Vagococcus silagei]
MGKLEKKIAIVTGGAQGMGETHVRLFLKEGAKVVFTDINEEVGLALEKELNHEARFIKHDVSSEDDWKHVIDETMKLYGRLDILVNNAGISMNESLFDMTVEKYNLIYKINQLSVFMGTKFAAEVMKENGSGSIINVSSINGLVGGAVGYTDTKFAVRGFTKAAALQLAPLNIRVNSVHPGVIATPMIMQEDSKDAIEAFSQFIPMKRVSQPEEISNLVLFLASDDSSYSTGAEFVADGGLTAQ